MQEKLELGTVISVPERKRTLYKIVSYTGSKYRVVGCENTPGYPLKTGPRAGNYVVPFTHAGLIMVGKGTSESPQNLISSLPASTEKKTRVADLNVFIPRGVKEMFETLESELSPENLCCDGELSRTETSQKYARIMKLWGALEAYIGQKVEPYV